VTQFSLPAIPEASQPSPGSAPGPVAITVGPDGALWFVGVPGKIGRITTTGVVTEFALPAGATATAITAGPDGALWFTGVPGEVGRITTSGVVTEFPVPAVPPPAGSPAGTASTPATLSGITVGPDGALWFAGVPGEIGRITTSGVVTEFPLPEIPPPAGSPAGTAGTVVTAAGVTAGPDGALWFTDTQPSNSLVGRITTTGAVTEYPTTLNLNPTIATGPDGDLWVSGGADLARITPSGDITLFRAPGNFSNVAELTRGPDGNVWFTEEENGTTVGEQPAIGAISHAGATSLYPIPQGTTLDPSRGLALDPTSITTGPDGAMWFADGAEIGRITTDGAVEQFPLTTPGATVQEITSGPDDTLWFTQQDSSEEWEIGRITADGAITLYPPLPTNVDSVGGIVEAANGDLWFTEGLGEPVKNGDSGIIGRITPKGEFTSFPTSMWPVVPITIGPGGNVWFAGALVQAGANYDANYAAIGEVTSKGQVKVYDVPSTVQRHKRGSYYDEPAPPTLISGPDGDLWFGEQSGKTTGIARISTSGKQGSTIPTGNADDLTRGPDGRVWFVDDDPNGPSLGVATRSGIVVTEYPPGLNFSRYVGDDQVYNTMTLGPDGNLWLTNGNSSIERISGLDTLLGSLDYRHRPKTAPDYVRSSYGNYWTNTTSSAQPTFAGIAQPGSEVTLWVQMQGQQEPVSIGQVKASKFDGSWTLNSQVKLSNGYYAVTATQSGDTGPPSVLYSLVPDASGNLSNALVIQSSHGGKAKA
jgi:streptogramin lyase